MILKEQVLEFYNIEEERFSEDLHATLYRLSHKGSGARVAVISNEDENKVFYVGFRTPPTDSTGVPHILEHSVLCGSKNFPVKDPFIELAKGSLNTFLNAITYPDRTLYPIASCNDQDFQNLMHIYLDAAFYPNIYKEKKVFEKEGWHYELESLDAPLTINGIVYNEMKGAFSSAEDVLEREIMNSLFPDTCYGVESGGDPDCIPDLTYEQFLEFHSTLYHPANSFIYLYGNMDVWEKLFFIHESYLKDFSLEDKGIPELDTHIQAQPTFVEYKELSKPYPVMEGEDTVGKAFLTYNVVAGTSLDAELCTALEILDYALCSAPGAPLKQALVDAGIGKDVYSNFEDGIYQPYFSIVAKDADASQKEQFVAIIEEELKRIVSEGFDKKTIQAALHYFEFRYKEADFGRWPKGIMWGLTAMDSWNYADDAPFLHLEADAIYEAFKVKAEQGYFEGLVERYLLNNTHKSILVMYPEPGLTAKNEARLAEKLADVKAGMSEEELRQIMDEQEALEEYRNSEDSPETLECIPLLKREDLKRETQPYVNELKEVQGIRLLCHPLYTKGIAYVRLIFDTKNVPQDLFPYVTMLRACMGYMNTTKHSYGELFNEMNLVSGGISPVTNIYTHADDFDKATVTFEIKCKMLYEDMQAAVELMEEMLFDTIYADKKRLYEIIAEGKSRLQSQMTGSAHTVSAIRAMSYFSGVAAINEVMNGITLYRFYDELERNFEQKYEETAAKLQELCKVLFRKENFMSDITAEEDGIAAWEAFVPKIADKLYTCDVRTGKFEPEVTKKNEGFMTSGQVQYVCSAGNFFKKGYEYTGAFQVLKVMMGYEYLWSQIREKGGAYGCMCAFGKTGDCYFVSYRDPNLEKTIDVYKHAAEAVASFTADERTMTQYIIGAVSEMDAPMTPSALGVFSLGGYMTHRSEEDKQKERDQILNCTPEDIQALAGHIKAFMSENALCVVGNAD
ncbi:MAG: insulinase family protein, partial [Lachnospiraceae bacterium]|nr:insulinase family protein [Lachnospiraceae bacterium]